ncbi:MAG: VOC family protein [Proteobacteria bacterium]|nr:VOC family protein [Pseudomonadota bacterium]MCA0425698.1 VOC family protein [Pseudomonadota bacterium]
MEPRVSLITLGVADLAVSRRFYEALGFVASTASQGDVVFFQAGSMALALYPRAALAEDATVSDSPAGFSGITLAHNLRSEAEVDALMAHAASCGARLVKPPQNVFWGGYSGYFSDPDGHLWEIAHNPFFPLDDAGNLHLPA